MLDMTVKMTGNAIYPPSNPDPKLVLLLLFLNHEGLLSAKNRKYQKYLVSTLRFYN